MRIRLIGDHSDVHCGSAAVFDVLTREAQKFGSIVQGEDYDLLIVNGEGSMHHASGTCRAKIEEISRALAHGKMARLINSVWQENPDELSAAIAGCSEISVREIRSQRELQIQGIPSRVHLDLAFQAPIDGGKAALDPREVAVTDFYSTEFRRFVRIQGPFDDDHHFLDMRELSWQDLVATLRTKKLLLTGRHHAVYAACKARTPFLATKGNTHKIEGLLETAKVRIPVHDSFISLRKNIKWLDRYRDEYEKLFDWMEQQEPWKLEI